MIDVAYLELMQQILTVGEYRETRNGATLSVFRPSPLRHRVTMQHRGGGEVFTTMPILSSKRVAYKIAIEEMLWMLRGETNITGAMDRGVNVWLGDAYRRYAAYAERLREPDYSVHVDDPSEGRVRIMREHEFAERLRTDTKFAAIFGEIGPTYGGQYRGTNSGHGIDQMTEVLKGIISDPFGRRHIMHAWEVGRVGQTLLPPCMWAFQFYVGKNNTLDMYADIRSSDVAIGLPFNLIGASVVHMVAAKWVKMVPRNLTVGTGDAHLYAEHIDLANEQVNRITGPSPTVNFIPEEYVNIHDDMSFGDFVGALDASMFEVIGYDPAPALPYKLIV